MSEIIGKKIVKVRKMTRAEAQREGWDITNQLATVLVLGDGTKLYASRDDEGNGIGTMFGSTKVGEQFYVVSPEFAKKKLKKVM